MIQYNRLEMMILLLVLAMPAWAADRLVPGQYATIQDAVDASVSGDTIIISQGTYVENVILGPNLTLMSTDPNDPAIVESTVIDGGGTDRVLDWNTGLPGEFLTVLGLTLTNGLDLGDKAKGAALQCSAGTVTVQNCRFINNHAKIAGAIYYGQAVLTCRDSLFWLNKASSFNEGAGGAVYSPVGELHIERCSFIDNFAAFEGGAAASDHGAVYYRDSLFQGNSARWGGAINTSHYPAEIDNCIFIGNTAFNDGTGGDGGAIRAKDLTEIATTDMIEEITNCTFVSNTAHQTGGAVFIRAGGTIAISNSIVWNNIAFIEGPQLGGQNGGTAITVSYSCVQGGSADVYMGSGTLTWLPGNIDTDPLFADEPNEDLHLKSTVGRWDPNTASWVIDAVNSPCIDAGDSNSDWTSEGFPHGSRINMGAYGGTAQGSLSTIMSGNLADIDRDGAVNSIDLELLSLQWLSQGFLLYEDLNRDGVVDFLDFVLLADNWGWGL